MTSLAAMRAAFGGADQVGAGRFVVPGPGHSLRDRSLSISFGEGPAGYLLNSFAGDSFVDCVAHVEQRLGLKAGLDVRPVERAPRHLDHDPDRAERIARALAIWRSAVDPRGTIVERYLAGRSLKLDDEVAGHVVRFHRALWHDGAERPVMVALFRDIATDEPCGVQRVFLTPNGEKVDRGMLGRAARAAIKLDADEHVATGLVIGEGVETCLAARMAGFRPCWALGSAGAIGTFPVLAGVDAIMILGETDATGANERATRRCAANWNAAGREALIITPRASGDMNDVVREVRQ